MKQVWKFPLFMGSGNIEMPVGAEILHVAEQNGQMCLWALVDPHALSEGRRFMVIGTGHEIVEPVLRHIGTALMFGGSLVFHAFEVKNV